MNAACAPSSLQWTGLPATMDVVEGRNSFVFIMSVFYSDFLELTTPSSVGLSPPVLVSVGPWSPFLGYAAISRSEPILSQW